MSEVPLYSGNLEVAAFDGKALGPPERVELWVGYRESSRC